MSSATVNGITLAYDDTGRGKDVLVPIHGHPFNRSMWRSQFDTISRIGWRVIQVTCRTWSGKPNSTLLCGVSSKEPERERGLPGNRKAHGQQRR